ncbi:MAG: aspartyl protease family protein [bacterium]
MSRPLVEIEIDGKKLNALLDTGAHRSYIREQIVEKFPKGPVEPFEVKLGGEILKFGEVRMVSGVVKDSRGRRYRFTEHLFEVKDLGEENGKRIDALLGARVLEDWGTQIDESVTPPDIDFRILRKGVLFEL